ncbi:MULTISPECIES: carbon starvation protein A [Sporomusa]|jgi:carbon starvation protein|uniref:Carbon starvation protein A n=1 Tax=Sporomusa sphaeroides DSM 2875 TaxID=1337886 RepID=A0ABP2C8V6_9FIRM|nr:MULTISPECIES: carbon starvation protein A [Sporomusa]MCM0759070.1 carbon starvation protein A [Sporomusa sphaeroides DSM 2875]OLS54763.1 carbon starvation protein A [Sporomusa sphaeroides DSM 2875]CVK20088.1 Carbon starvation protein A [Sporomusa sphaeroides DSM 2875]HML33189.1 carbon starvation protein A [Sporomusa sphaeroides]
MNGFYLVLIAALVLTICYRYYGAFMAAKVLALDPNRPTPAVVHEDGHDYVPTNKWVTFGHHFAAIAGAGPLVGPVLAAQFGYLPGTIWLLIGACIGGAVHDMIILFASIRHDGKSIAEIAKAEIGKSAGLAAALAVIFILVITMAGMGIAVANALFNSPWGAFTVGATIPIALFIGIYMRYLRPGCVGEASFIGVALVIAAVFGGAWIQHSAWAPFFTLTRSQLDILLPLYGFVAAALPVWLLLAPRDYLSTYMKIGTIAALALGIIIVQPQIQMPAITPFISGGGPVVPGPVWPFVCITVACGAISGFHSVIATGTTPKMITNESEILPIGFGAMLAESFIGLMALIAATSLVPADYFAINSTPAAFAKLGMVVEELPWLSQMVGEDVAGRPGGAVSLAVGMAHIFAKIPGLENFMSFLYHFAIMFEALFILTIIDAGTRVGRYLLQEVGGMIYKPLGDVHWTPGIVFTSALISFAWGYLIFGGSISSIWPLFGLSNQLLASMTLTIGTTVLLRMGKAKYLWVTLVPLSFMLVTALTAGFYNIFEFYLPKGQMLLAGSSAVMMILIVFVIIDAVKVWFNMKPGKAAEETL